MISCVLCCLFLAQGKGQSCEIKRPRQKSKHYLTGGVVYSVLKSSDACGVISWLNEDPTRLNFSYQGRVETPLNSVLLRLLTFALSPEPQI